MLAVREMSRRRFATEEERLTSQLDRKEHDAAQHDIDDLYNKVDKFVAQLYQRLGEKERSDDPFKASRN